MQTKADVSSYTGLPVRRYQPSAATIAVKVLDSVQRCGRVSRTTFYFSLECAVLIVCIGFVRASYGDVAADE